MPLNNPVLNRDEVSFDGGEFLLRNLPSRLDMDLASCLRRRIFPQGLSDLNVILRNADVIGKICPLPDLGQIQHRFPLEGNGVIAAVDIDGVLFR